MNKLIFGLLTLTVFASSTILPSNNIRVAVGQNFEVQLQSNNDLGKLDRCTINFREEPIFHYNQKPNSVDELKRKDGVILQKFSDDLCGIKIIKATKNLSGKWLIQLKGSTGHEYNESFTVEVTG